MPYIDNVVFKAVNDFTLSPSARPMPGQKTSFKAGDIAEVTHLYRTKGGASSGIPVWTESGWQYPVTPSQNIKLVYYCNMGDDTAQNECVSPYATVIDNEAQAGGEAPPPEESSTGSTLFKAGVGLGLLYLISKL